MPTGPLGFFISENLQSIWTFAITVIIVSACDLITFSLGLGKKTCKTCLERVGTLPPYTGRRRLIAKGDTPIGDEIEKAVDTARPVSALELASGGRINFLTSPMKAILEYYGCEEVPDVEPEGWWRPVRCPFMETGTHPRQ